MAIRIITDSASDYVNTEKDIVTILPMTVTFGEKQYRDGVDLTHEQFYEMLVTSDVLPVTSLVTPGQFEEAYREVTKAGDTALVITVSAKLSGTYQSAVNAVEGYEGKVFVVDSSNATIGENVLVQRAVELVKKGMDVQAIVDQLNEEKKEIRVIALLDTLEYLKKGGRISGSSAMIGGLLNIKPVVSIEDGEVAVLGKARGPKSGNNHLITEVEKTNGIDFTRPYLLGYTGNDDTLLKNYITASSALYEGHTDHLPIATIGGTIGTHVGPGAIALAFFHK